MTRVFTIDPAQPDAVVLRIAADALRRGELVAFPTETVYGLGANALDSIAVARIFEAKGRPANDPIIVHIHDLAQLYLVAQRPSAVALQLAERFWPGALTLVLKRRPLIPANVSAGLDTVAVRMPSGSVIRALLKGAQIPIAAPSANTFSRPSATTAAHVLEDLDGRIDLVLDGGAAEMGLESTVLDLTGDVPTVLRPGAITLEELRTVIPDVAQKRRMIDTDESVSAPGMLVKHYSPRARLMLYDGEHARVISKMCEDARRLQSEGKRAGVLAIGGDALRLAPHATVMQLLGDEHDLEGIAASLFAAMRSLDAAGVDVILARAPVREGLGAAIYDRLLRAAEGQVIRVEH
jgi:L-threonylcarbamoyladenylate synthase